MANVEFQKPKIKGFSRPKRQKGTSQDADFFPTPRWTTEILLRNWEFEGSVWECACGDGAISKVFEASGYSVVSTDLYDRGYGKSGVDFLLQRKLLAENIVTNPPFRLMNEFTLNILNLKPKATAILGRLQYLETKGRYKIFKRFPPRKVIVVSDRVEFFSEVPGGQWSIVWCIWERDYKGITELVWDCFHKPQSEQMEFSEILQEEK